MVPRPSPPRRLDPYEAGQGVRGEGIEHRSFYLVPEAALTEEGPRFRFEDEILEGSHVEDRWLLLEAFLGGAGAREVFEIGSEGIGGVRDAVFADGEDPAAVRPRRCGEAGRFSGDALTAVDLPTGPRIGRGCLRPDSASP